MGYPPVSGHGRVTTFPLNHRGFEGSSLGSSHLNHRRESGLVSIRSLALATRPTKTKPTTGRRPPDRRQIGRRRRSQGRRRRRRESLTSPSEAASSRLREDDGHHEQRRVSGSTTGVSRLVAGAPRTSTIVGSDQPDRRSGGRRPPPAADASNDRAHADAGPIVTSGLIGRRSVGVEPSSLLPALPCIRCGEGEGKPWQASRQGPRRSDFGGVPIDTNAAPTGKR